MTSDEKPGVMSLQKSRVCVHTRFIDSCAVNGYSAGSKIEIIEQ